MKSILEFNLPEDKNDLKLALNAGALKVSIDEIFELFRKRLKYGMDSELSLSHQDLLEKIRDEMYEVLEDNGVSHLEC
jgi:hypothetical protein